MKDPESMSDEVFDVAPPFEGEQSISFDDYDLRLKEYGFWVLLNFSGPEGQRASWSGNFYKDPDTDGRKQAHNIAWSALRDFFKAAGYSNADIPACSARSIVTALNKMVSVNGDNLKVKAFISVDKDRGYTNASRFKAA